MTNELSLGDYLAILRRRWLLVAAGLLAAIVVGVLWSLLQSPRFASTATVLISSGSVTEVFDPVTGEARGARAITNEARFAESDQVRDAAERKLEDLGITKAEEIYSVAADESADADELRIRATSATANGAALVAQTYAETYIELRRQLVVQEYLDTASVIQDRIEEVQTQLDVIGDADTAQRRALEAQLVSFSTVLSSLDVTAELGGGSRQVIGRARIPSQPFSPQTGRNVVLAVALGLFAGTGLALLVDSLDQSITGKDDLEAATPGVPNLAVVPTVRDWRERSATRIESIQSPQSRTAESYRTLRTALEFASIDREVRILQVTSANPGEGKTTTAVNLAVSVARAGRTVILVDADLRKPRVHSFFDLPVEPGLTNAILGQVTAAELGHLIERDAGSLSAVPSGPLPPGPSELLGSARTAAVLAELSDLADLVIVDSAPVLPVSDAIVLARKADATLLVANGSRTSAPELEAAVDLLGQVDATIIGTVLNQVKRGAGDGYGYGYGYGFEEKEDASPQRTLGRRPST